MSRLAPYRKTVTAVVTGALGWAGIVIASAPEAITAGEWQMGGVILATALGVYAVPNNPQ